MQKYPLKGGEKTFLVQSVIPDGFHPWAAGFADSLSTQRGRTTLPCSINVTSGRSETTSSTHWRHLRSLPFFRGCVTTTRFVANVLVSRIRQIRHINFWSVMPRPRKWPRIEYTYYYRTCPVVRILGGCQSDDHHDLPILQIDLVSLSCTWMVPVGTFRTTWVAATKGQTYGAG